MQATKLEVKAQLDMLYVQLEDATVAYSKNQTAENETLMNKVDAAIDELIDVLILMDEQSQGC